MTHPNDLEPRFVGPDEEDDYLEWRLAQRKRARDLEDFDPADRLPPPVSDGPYHYTGPDR